VRVAARPTFSWQYLGAWVVNIDAISDAALDRFHSIGGRWVVVVLYNDDASGPKNRELIDNFKLRCYTRGIAVGMWANGEGGNPVDDAEAIAEFASDHGLYPIIVDCEGPYQWPGGNPQLLPQLLLELRKHFPLGTRPIGHTTNSPNDSQIYNGRVGPTSQPTDLSHRDLGVRVLPQWYNSPVYGQGQWTRADETMAWLKTDGMKDNLHDSGYTDGRAVPLAWFKGVFEVTGLESAVLATALPLCKDAKVSGYDFGASLYTLDNIPDEDYATMAQYRGVLYKG
jgi:hypothetical protein